MDKAREQEHRCESEQEEMEASASTMFVNILLGKAWYGWAQSSEMGQNILPTMGEMKN